MYYCCIAIELHFVDLDKLNLVKFDNCSNGVQTKFHSLRADIENETYLKRGRK
jgi:hypothetical protein